MDSTVSMVVLLYVLFLCSTQSLFTPPNKDVTKIPFDYHMFPTLNPYTAINSSAINVSWIPSPAINGTDLSQFTGQLTFAIYAVTLRYTESTVIINYPLTKLN